MARESSWEDGGVTDVEPVWHVLGDGGPREHAAAVTPRRLLTQLVVGVLAVLLVVGLGASLAARRRRCTLTAGLSRLTRTGLPMRPVVLTLGLGLAGSAAAQDAPKAVIEKAIKAHGGADLLAKFAAERVTVKGTISIMGMEVEMTATSVTQYPDKQKVTGTLSLGGQELKIVQVNNGDSMSVSINGQPLPLSDEQKADTRQEMFADSLTRLVPLLKGDAYKLTAGPEVAVDGNPVKDSIGLIVAIRSHQPGETITLSVLRGKERKEIKVTLGSESDKPE